MSGQNSETISPLAPKLPPDFDFFAAMTEDERVSYIEKVLARSEDEALTYDCKARGCVVQLQPLKRESHGVRRLIPRRTFSLKK
jgi:hypothetical protein